MFVLKKLISKKIDPVLFDLYLNELKTEGADVLETTNPYEVFRLRFNESIIIAYNSGKITYLNTEIMKNLFVIIDQRIGTQKIDKKNIFLKSKKIYLPKITSMKIKMDLIAELITKVENSTYTKIPTKSKYEINRFKKDQNTIIIYKTGSVVFNIETEVINILKELITRDYKDISEILIGQDETGKGEWWGPMTIASVAMKVSDIIELQIMGAMDSKKLNEQKISYLFSETQKRAISMRVIPIGAERFNELYEEFHSEDQVLDDLLAWGHTKALDEVIQNSNVDLNGSKLIIDEFNKIKTQKRIESLVKKNNLKIIQEHKADVKYPIVSIASICAKHVRNLEVKDLEEKFNIKFKNSNPKELLKIENCKEFLKLAYIK